MVGNAILKTKKGVYPVMITQYETSYDRLPSFEGHIVGENIARYVRDLAPVPIKKVHFNDPATVVLWSDGTKTVVKCQPGDTYSKETGLALCIAKKFLGNKGNFNEVLKAWIPEEVEEVIEMSGFRVGDKVQVVRSGQTYSSYSDWVKRNVTKPEDVKKWNSGRLMKDGDIGVIKYLAPHERTYEGNIAYVDIDGKCYMIHVDGLEKV